MKKLFLILVPAAHLMVAHAQCDIAGWLFNGDLTADSQGTYPLINSGATLDTGHTAVPGTAAHFGEFIKMEVNDSVFRLPTFSMATWYYLTDTNYFSTLASVRINPASSPYNSYNLCVGSYTGHQMSFYLTTADGSDMWIHDTATVQYAAWQHVAVTCVFDGTYTQVKLYANGVLHVHETVLGEILYPAGNPLVLGNIESADQNNAFKGLLDDFMYYSCAIGATEVADLYNGTVTGIQADAAGENTALYPNPAADQVYLRLPHDQDIWVYDASGACVYSARGTRGIHRIGTGAFAPGLYWVRTSSGRSQAFIRQ